MTQPPGWGQAPPQSPYGTGSPASPPPRPARPWWFWVLGGCGGCAVITLLVVVGLGMAGMNFLNQAKRSIGSVTPQTVQQSLGSDVPLYPGGKLNTQLTSMPLMVMRGVEQGLRRPTGSILKGVAILTTADPPEKVLEFYDTRLKAAGWKPTEQSGDERQYQKGSEYVTVAAGTDNSGNGQETNVAIMRGSAEMLRHRTRMGAPGQKE